MAKLEHKPFDKPDETRTRPSSCKRSGMRALGMIEGQNFLLEERYADGDESRLPNLAAELIWPS